MDLSYATASELVAALQGGSLSSRELLDHVTARIDQVDPALNAVITRDPEGAAAAAAAADDARAAGRSLGPLHGLVMTIKDVWETAGVRTACGVPELVDHVPAVDAAAVARLRAAGAVVVGKTNVPIHAGDLQTFNDPFGTTNNPWDVGRTPGGSSGGAAAALAAGITPLELGSDIGGSIRVPAHLCGVYGLKPSWGVIPQRGHIPGPPGTLLDADVNVGGPMARSLADLVLAFDLLVGPLPDQAVAWRLELPDDRPPEDLAELRFGVTLDDPDFPVDAASRAVLERLVDDLVDAGAQVEAGPMPVPMAEAFDSWLALVLPIIGTGLPDELYDVLATVAPVPGDTASTSLSRLAGSARDRFRADQRRQVQRRAWAERFESVDAWLAPCFAVPAFEHDHRPMPERTTGVNGRAVPSMELTAWPGAIGAMLLPAVAVPAGQTPAGLPVGVQVVGPYLGDKRLLRIAELVDAIGPGFTPPPGL